jgi:hypothetical protein
MIFHLEIIIGKKKTRSNNILLNIHMFIIIFTNFIQTFYDFDIVHRFIFFYQSLLWKS